MQDMDFTKTLEFLKLINKENSDIAIQTFDDRDTGEEKRKELTKQFFGKIEDFKDDLKALNQAGAGIFIMVNDPIIDSTKGSAIRHRTAHFADSDDGDRTEVPLESTVKVQTANGFHWYWVLNQQYPIAGFEQLQKSIARLLKTDSSVCNRNRLMRLPGFFHLKDPAKPVMVTIVHKSEKRYSLSDLETAFGKSKESVEASAFLISNPKDRKWERGTRNTNLYKFIKQNQRFLPTDITEEQFFYFANNANLKFCEEPLPEDEVKSMTASKYKEFKKNIDTVLAAAPTLTELLKMDFPKKESLVDKLIFKKQISIIGSRPKMGKSTLIRGMTVAIVDNLIFLGRKTTQGKVLYLGMEELLDDIRQDFIDMDVKNTDNVRITNLSDSNSVEEYSEKLHQLVKAFRPDLVILDTMVHLLGVDDMNDYSKTSIALKKFRTFAEQHNCHVLLIHHNRKGEGMGNESLLGSTGISGAVDLIMDLKQNDKNQRFFQTQGRSSQIHFEKTALKFDSSSKMCLIDEGYNPVEDLESRIMTAISEYELPSVEAVRKKTGGNSTTVNNTIKSLRTAKKIEKQGKFFKVIEAKKEEEALDV